MLEKNDSFLLNFNFTLSSYILFLFFSYRLLFGISKVTFISPCPAKGLCIFLRVARSLPSVRFLAVTTLWTKSIHLEACCLLAGLLEDLMAANKVLKSVKVVTYSQKSLVAKVFLFAVMPDVIVQVHRHKVDCRQTVFLIFQ